MKFPCDVFDRGIEILESDSPTRQHIRRILYVVEYILMLGNR